MVLHQIVVTGLVFLATLMSQESLGLIFYNKNLTGNLLDSLTGMNHLKTLNLSSNYFHCSVPSSIFKLPRLELLDLSENSFSGPVPPILNLPLLRIFNLSFTSFNGKHPILPNSPYLQIFDISSNSFFSKIYSSMCNYSNSLQILCFSENNFYGNFPIGYGNCTSLTELSVDMNRLNGTLPDDLFVLTNLTKLNLQFNSFTGTLSTNFANLSNLIDLNLSDNNFLGAIPDIFHKVKKLESFYASSNKLTGMLLSSLTNSSTLKVINLRNNSLTDEINLNCTSLVSLNVLDLGSNRFTGQIPSNLPLCVQMKTLNLSRNILSGEIPSSFKIFNSLTYLSLSSNNFSNITLALQILQKLPNLSTLILTKNFQFGEAMPFHGIEGFLSIKVFVIANCELYGLIPPWLINLKKLSVLDISGNRLTGSIPPWLGNFDHLFYLDISWNSLTGEIPSSLAQIKSLMMKNPTDQPLQFQYDQINSFLPSFRLSHNNLVGPILPYFGNLTNLVFLDLSYNSLNGTIPNQLAGMFRLESLDLSHNNLTGTIPQLLSFLTFLFNLDLSYNNLSGMIPVPLYDNFGSLAYDGNVYLCGFPTNKTCLEYGGIIVDSGEIIEDNEHEMLWFYICSAIGFIFGWWCVWGVFMFHRDWRIAYFQMTDKMFDNIYVHFVLTMRKLKQLLRG